MNPVIYYGVGVGGLVLLILLELRAEAFRSSTFTDARRVRRNWSYLASALLAMTVVHQVTGRLGEVVPRLITWGSFALEVGVCFLVGELLNWTAHWLKHKSAFLWKLHFQHHRESRYSLWLVAHTHPLEVCVTGTLMSVALVLCGFSPAAMQTYLLFYSLALTYHHSTFDYSLGPLDWLVVSPAYHRRHHAIGDRGNYGAALTIWDVVFGTASFPASRHAEAGMRFGIEAGGREPLGFQEELVWFLEPEADEKPVFPRSTYAFASASGSGRLPRA